MRRFEKVGLTRAQAEQVTELLTETICMNKVKITEQFVSKAALEKVCLQPHHSPAARSRGNIQPCRLQVPS